MLGITKSRLINVIVLITVMLYISILMLLVAIAYYDVKYRRIPDILTILLWLSVVLLADSRYMAIGFLSVLILWGITDITARISGIIAVAWGDILLMGGFIPIVYSINYGGVTLSIACIILASLLSKYQQKKEPLGAYLLVIYLITWVLWLLA